MKKLVSLLLALVLVLSMSVTAFAAPDLTHRSLRLAPPSTDGINAEQTAWVFRVNDGYVEMRLWSLTYEKWLTDWIVVGPVVDP